MAPGAGSIAGGSPLTPYASHLTKFASRLTVGIALCLALAACGFHLRGQASFPFETLYIVNGNAPFAVQLARAIRAGSNTRIVENPKDAEVTMQILGETRERSILSLSGTGRVRELQLRYRVLFRVYNKENRDYISRGEVQLKRDLSYSDADVLGKEQEEALLYRDMQNDAVQQIMRRLQAARIETAATPSTEPVK
jgi:LPS-assembly lipoprotein